jgi:hypothetical protein
MVLLAVPHFSASNWEGDMTGTVLKMNVKGSTSIKFDSFPEAAVACEMRGMLDVKPCINAIQNKQ